MSVIIISATLLVVVVTSGLLGFFSRFNALDAELKERSVSTADACADLALLQLAQNPSYQGGTFALNDLDECRVGKVSAVGATLQFQVQATSSKTAVTNLKIIANAGDVSVVSWQETSLY